MFTGLVLAAAVSAASGHWQGTLQRGPATLAVSFDFPADKPDQGSFTASDLGAIDVPLAKVKQTQAAHWELVGDSTTLRFDGTVDGEPLLTMRDGTAGFFTAAELAAGKGVVLTEMETRPRAGKRPDDWHPPAPLGGVESYDSEQLDALR